MGQCFNFESEVFMMNRKSFVEFFFLNLLYKNVCYGFVENLMVHLLEKESSPKTELKIFYGQNTETAIIYEPPVSTSTKY